MLVPTHTHMHKHRVLWFHHLPILSQYLQNQDSVAKCINCVKMACFLYQEVRKFMSRQRDKYRWKCTYPHTHTRMHAYTHRGLSKQHACFCNPNRYEGTTGSSVPAGASHTFEENKGNEMSVRTVWLCQEKIESGEKACQSQPKRFSQTQMEESYREHHDSKREWHSENAPDQQCPISEREGRKEEQDEQNIGWHSEQLNR